MLRLKANLLIAAITAKGGGDIKDVLWTKRGHIPNLQAQVWPAWKLYKLRDLK